MKFDFFENTLEDTLQKEISSLRFKKITDFTLFQINKKIMRTLITPLSPLSINAMFSLESIETQSGIQFILNDEQMKDSIFNICTIDFAIKKDGLTYYLTSCTLTLNRYYFLMFGNIDRIK